MNQYAVEADLTFTYEEQKLPALDGVRGTVEPGQCVVLCGGSGCGKSTLLRCINRLIPQFYDGQLKGFVRLNGQDLAECSIGQAGKQAASVFQDPRSQFFTMNSSTEVAFGPENFGVPREELVRRTEAAFTEFHLAHLKNRSVFRLSSGQRQLIAILSAWAMDTDVFLLDEPTANLDHDAICQLASLLRQLKARGKTLVISEHRLSYLTGIADRYWYLSGGRLQTVYDAEAFLAFSNGELQALGLRCTDEKSIRACPRTAEPPETVHRFSVRNLTFSYETAGPPLLSDLDFSAETGEIVGLIGANGCGKTTFGKIAAGLLRPNGGSFTLDGVPIPFKKLRDHAMFIMQEAEFQFFTNSVLHELTYGLPDAKRRLPEIEGLLKEAGLWEQRNQHPFSLSGGQMQKLVLLLACLSPKPLVILDEPTAGLDYRSLTVCAGLMARMARTKLVLVITHDPELIAQVCTRCAALEHGRAAREFSLAQPEAFPAVQQYLSTGLVQAADAPPQPKARPLADPRVKLAMLLLSMVVAIGADLPLIVPVFVGLLPAALYERRWAALGGFGGLMALILGLYAAVPSVITSFLAHFFPRIFLIGLAVSLVVSGQEAPRTLAALRKLHIPEPVIMVFSVIFRFFPVLRLDLGIMNQSMKTRGFFPTLRSRLRAIPAYAEILIVPMVFRVIRIAEALSASAETRGIALPGRRSSLLALRLRTADWLLLAVFLICSLIGLISIF